MVNGFPGTESLFIKAELLKHTILTTFPYISVGQRKKPCPDSNTSCFLTGMSPFTSSIASRVLGLKAVFLFELIL